MKRIIFILSILCLGMSMSAQSGIVKTRKANDSSGKMLTMEETILSRELSPRRTGPQWKVEQTWPVAYTEGQSLYIKAEDGTVTAVAESENDQITYGQFVSRNEFGISDGIFWSPDKSRLAFYRKDESRVTTFPLLDITTRTGTLREIKYPMAGMDSENVQLGIYDLASGKTL